LARRRRRVDGSAVGLDEDGLVAVIDGKSGDIGEYIAGVGSVL
jgi:hypothetical protein